MASSMASYATCHMDELLRDCFDSASAIIVKVKWEPAMQFQRAAFISALISSTWAFILHFQWSQVLAVLLLTLWNSSTVHAESQRVLEGGKGPAISFTKLWINPQGDNFYQKKNLGPSIKNSQCEFFSGYKPYKLATDFSSPQIQQYITTKVLKKLKTIKKNNIHLIFIAQYTNNLWSTV